MTIHRNLAICAYCGQAFDVDPTAPHHEIVSACAKHAQECERNPLVQEIARLKAEVARRANQPATVKDDNQCLAYPRHSIPTLAWRCSLSAPCHGRLPKCGRSAVDDFALRLSAGVGD